MRAPEREHPEARRIGGGVLRQVYERLHARFGPRHWWPAETPLEVVVGAILTQNTAWANVERASGRLRAEGLLEFEALRSVPESRLKELIRPAGYYNQKARYLTALIQFLDKECGGDLARFFSQDASALRAKLLKLPGIGPETADSMLLYAGGLSVFVVDAYTFRIFSRLKLVPAGASYGSVQGFFTQNLPHDPALFNEYHALIVELGKRVCRPQPRCEECPLLELPCPTGPVRRGRKHPAPGPGGRSAGRRKTIDKLEKRMG